MSFVFSPTFILSFWTTALYHITHIYTFSTKFTFNLIPSGANDPQGLMRPVKHQTNKSVLNSLDPVLARRFVSRVWV